MACAHPLILRYKDYGTISVPCGQCINCRTHSSQVWSDRIRAEILIGHKPCLFLTLTYDDEHIPFSFNDDDVVRTSLSPEHLTNFLKRVRSRISDINPDYRIKYFACGEYGGRFGRPHYHVLLINVLRTRDTENLIRSCWSFGTVDIQSPRVIEDCVNYVTGYIKKKYSGKLAVSMYGSAVPPFLRASVNLGRDYFLSHADSINRDECLLVRGRPHSVPRSVLSLEPFSDLRLKFHHRFFLDNFAHADPDKEDRTLSAARKRESELKTLSLRSV